MVPGTVLAAALRDEGVEPDLVGLLDVIAAATERIEALVRRAPLTHLVGLTGGTNVQGEAAHKLDTDPLCAINPDDNGSRPAAAPTPAGFGILALTDNSWPQ